MDPATLDQRWRALYDQCLRAKRRDGQNIDNYQLVETRTVGDDAYLYFRPTPTGDVITTDHFGCRVDPSGDVQVLYEG